MIVAHYKMGWNLPSLLTFSMTIHSTFGQMMKIDFMGMESLPLASSSVFEMEKEQPLKISKEELTPEVESDMVQSNHSLLGSWLTQEDLPDFQRSRMKSYPNVGKWSNVTYASTYTTCMPSTDIHAEIRHQAQLHRKTRDPCQAFPRVWSNNTRESVETLCRTTLYEFFCNDKLKLSVRSLKTFVKEIEPFVIPISGYMCKKPILSLEQVECTSETQLTLKACVLKAINCNLYQGYCEKALRNQKLCKLVIELRKVLKQTQPLKKMDLLDDVEIEAIGDVGNEVDLLGLVAEADQNFEEDDEMLDDNDNESINGNMEDGNFYDSEESSDSFHGSYGRTPSPTPFTLDDARRAREFQEFGDLVMLDFRIVATADNWEQNLGDQDQAVPNSH